MMKDKEFLRIRMLGDKNPMKLEKNKAKFRGENNAMKQEINKEKIRKVMIKNWKEGKYDSLSNNLKEQIRNKTFNPLQNKNIRPNLPEKKTITILNSLKLGFQYTGDGKVWIDNFNPDFINENKKLIIEIFGDYFHNLPNYIERDKRRLESYSRNGYKTLIIWEHELEDRELTKQKILDFI